MTKTKTKTISSPKGLVLAVGSLATYAFVRRQRSKSSASKGSASAGPPGPPAPSPFKAGSHCTVLADEAEIVRWLTKAVAPVVLPLLDAYDVPRHEHEQAREALEHMIDEVFAKTVPQCSAFVTSTMRDVWKWLWCDVVVQLVLRGKLDEEIDDVLRRCLEPDFDPRAPKPDFETAPVEPPPGPPLPPPGPPQPQPLPMPQQQPMPQPLPELPVEPMPPMDGSEGGPPPNVWTASSRQELSELGVMRMMEGTAAGAPILGPAAHVVMLALNPVWPELEQARTYMMRLASENPGLTFVEVSFVDTQRHFGKPSDVNGIMWALTATGPDGRVFVEPIVRNDPHDPPPSTQHWTKVIAHASGFVGLRSVQAIARPRHFGDLVRTMARARRPPPAAVPAMRPRRPSRRHPRRRSR